MNTAQIINHPNTEFLLKSELNRVKQQLSEAEQKLQNIEDNEGRKQIMVFASNQYRFVNTSDIVMINSSSNYSTLYLANGDKLFTSKTLKHWESECNYSGLVRIHNSFLVNKNMIKSIHSKFYEIILDKGLRANYSRMSKSELVKLLGI